jgi:predicted metallopeptidase
MAAEVTFEDAKDLQAEVSSIIGQYKIKFGHLSSTLIYPRRRISDSPARWIARISLIPKRYKDLFGDAVYVLEVDQANFDCLTVDQKRCVLFHELCHTWLSEKGSYKLVQHDIMEFMAVIDEFGDGSGALPDTVRLVNIIKNKVAKGDKTEEAQNAEPSVT